MTIDVPFSLLNLTLTAPLVETPTRYFPCNPFDWGKSYNVYTLGKALPASSISRSELATRWLGELVLGSSAGPEYPV